MKSKGFSLLELIVVMAVVGILASVVVSSSLAARENSRDKERIANILKVQAAIEQYRLDNGRYPDKCTGAIGGWGGQVGSIYECNDGTNDYIIGLVPEYLSALPLDEKVPMDTAGYVYTVNADGTVYKFMARRTVESEQLTNDHEFSACDMKEYTMSNGVTRRSMCGQVIDSGNSTPHYCQNSNGYLQTSYAVWGGFANPVGTAGDTANNGILDRTQNIACKT